MQKSIGFGCGVIFAIIIILSTCAVLDLVVKLIRC